METGLSARLKVPSLSENHLTVSLSVSQKEQSLSGNHQPKVNLSERAAAQDVPQQKKDSKNNKI